MKRIFAALAVSTVAAPVLGVVALAQPARAGIESLKIAAEGEAYALRIEYDIPLPAGTGTIPHVVGEARRSPAGENAKGQAGAPSHMDLVVGGTVAKPHDKVQSLPEPYPTQNRLPETECFYPGSLADTKTLYPTDARGELKSLPPVVAAVAKCLPGPVADLRAASVGFGGPDTSTVSFGAVVQTGAVSADGLMRPLQGVVRADVAARAAGISVLNGVIKIAGVQVDSSSSTTGVKGGAASLARVAITDFEAAGQRFSISSDTLTAGPVRVPLVSSTADAFFKDLNARLQPTGCDVALLTTPARYPQGFVFRRPPPALGIEADGTRAAAMRAGLLVRCDIPDSVSSKTAFSPQQVQMVVGFAFTAVEAHEQAGGFGIGDLGTPLGTTFIDASPLSITRGLGPTVAGVAIGSVLPDNPVAAPAPPRDAAPRASRPSTRVIGTFRPLESSTRTLILVVGLLMFAALTHLGITRFRRVFDAP